MLIRALVVTLVSLSAAVAVADDCPEERATAKSKRWLVDNEPIIAFGAQYVKFGLPRLLAAGEVRRAAQHDGVGLFAEPGGAKPPDVIYVPVAAKCDFQPYQLQGIPVAAGKKQRVALGQTVLFRGRFGDRVRITLRSKLATTVKVTPVGTDPLSPATGKPNKDLVLQVVFAGDGDLRMFVDSVHAPPKLATFDVTIELVKRVTKR